MLSFSQNYLTRGFWGDEAWTSLISQLPYLQMLKTTAADFHPPGYYTMIELWYKFFPATEVSTRIVSIIFYFLTIFLVYKLASFISTSGESEPFRVNLQGESIPEVIKKKRLWGLLSALVVAVNPIFFTYAFEARNYTMFAFAATGSIYSLIKLSTTSSKKGGWLFIFVFFTTLGIYTHYYMFFILAAQGLYILLFDRKILLRMAGALAICALLYLPWTPFLLAQVSSVGQSYWIAGIDSHTHYDAIMRILAGEHENVFRPFLFWLSVSLLLVGLFDHIRRKSFEKPYLLIWFWAVVPFVLATLPGLSVNGLRFPFRSIFFWRYLIPAAVPMSMVIVHAAAKLPDYLFKGTIAMLFILSLTIDYLTLTRYPKTFRQVYATQIIGQIKPEDKIVTVLPSFAEVLYYRNRFGLENELIVSPEGVIQHSGKSLLDAYVESGVVKISDRPESDYFELRPGPNVVQR